MALILVSSTALVFLSRGKEHISPTPLQLLLESAKLPEFDMTSSVWYANNTMAYFFLHIVYTEHPEQASFLMMVTIETNCFLCSLTMILKTLIKNLHMEILIF